LADRGIERDPGKGGGGGEGSVREQEASVELDALVAERVMGWEVTRKPHPAMPDGGMVIMANFPPDGPEWSKIFKKGRAIQDIPMVPRSMLWNPSTDIRAAWEVAERAGVFILNRESMSEKRWRAGVYLHPLSARGRSERAVYAFADTAPLAICLAALKACGFPREDERRHF